MPRIRTLKPEIWHSRDFMALSPLGQLAFIALITLADDEGRLECDAQHLRATAIREAKVDRLRDQLRAMETLGMVQQYAAADKPYIQIVHWSSHQRVDKPRPSSLPPPPSRMVANGREDSTTPREPSSARARPRTVSDRIGEDLSPQARQETEPARRAAEVLTNQTEDPDVLAYAERFMRHAARAPSGDDLAFFRRIPYDCNRLSREAVLTAIDEVAEKHVGRGKPMPRATYLAGKLADLQAAASDAGATSRARSPNGLLAHISAPPRDPDDE